MTEVNKQEALRWAQNGCKLIWCKNKCSDGWHLMDKPDWYDTIIYITDDSQAELRKLQVDKPETEFECRSINSDCWEPASPGWYVNLKYRIKPKFKIGDKIQDKETKRVITISEMDSCSYIIEEEYWFCVLFIDQDNYQLYIGQFEYPIFKVANKGTEKEYIVKFTDMKIGKVVFARENSCKYVGYYDENWIEHTDTTYWEYVPYNKERGLYDKQATLCWNDCQVSYKNINFYSVTTKGVFNHEGKRSTAIYTNMIPYPHPDDDFIMDMYKELEQ